MPNQTQHLKPEEIRILLKDTEASAEEVAGANAHLADCKPCRETLRSQMPDASARVAQLLMPTADDAACLDEELIARYVHGDADAFETEMVEMHLEDCRFCAADVADLRAFRQEMEATAARKTQIAASALPTPEPALNSGAIVSVAANVHLSEPAGQSAVPSPIPWWQRLRERSVPVWTRPMFPLLAGAGLATCLIYVALVIPIRAQLQNERESQNRRLEAQNGRIKELQTEITTLKQKAADADEQQGQLAQLRQELVQTQQDLKVLQKQQSLLVRGATAPDRRTPGPEVPPHPVPLPSDFANYLNQPQLALADGTKQLDLVATDHGQTLGGPQGSTPGIDPISPVACIVSTQLPHFQWRPVIGASRYRVELRVQDRNIELPSNPPTPKTAFDLSQPLSRDAVYSWQVIALDGQNHEITRSRPAKFKVTDAWTAAELQRFAGTPLARSIVFARAGMPTEAAVELRKYLSQNPDSTQAKQLLQQIQALKQKAREIAQ
jgi:hypothetical protein